MGCELVFWFTGLSGAGKTTVAVAVKALLESEGYSVLILDGDDVRNRLHVHLGFAEKDILQNNALIAEMCLKYRCDHDVVLVPIISPYRSSREDARKLLGRKFFEIYFSAPLDTVVERDVKGLYRLARENKINNMIGFSPSNVYEPPIAPELEINSARQSVAQSTTSLYQFIHRQIDAVISVTKIEVDN